MYTCIIIFLVFVGYNYAVDTIKSVVLILALMDKHITVERCVQLSRLEQDFQVCIRKGFQQIFFNSFYCVKFFNCKKGNFWA